MNKDLQHLKLLSIFYYVIAGMVAFFSCFALLYLFMGIVFVAAPPAPSGGGEPPPPALGWAIIIIASAFMLLGWSWAVCLVIAGWFLGRCRHYLYCMFLGCSVLLFHPFGTILGVFTIIVLLRPSVKQLFETGGQLIEAERDEEDFHDHVRRDSYNIRQ